MTAKLLPDDVWKAVHPLIPQRPERSRGGRPPVDDRGVLTGIVFVLKTGIAWEDLPGEMGCGCGMTCLRRLREWRRTGVWAKIRQVLADRLPRADRIDWQRAELHARPVSSRRRRRRIRGLSLVPHGHAAAREGLEAHTHAMKCASAGDSEGGRYSVFMPDGREGGVLT